MVTIKEVSKIADVSIASISRYINKTGYVSDEKVLRIEQAILKLGYKPRSTKLNFKKRKIIGLLVSNNENEFFSELKYLIEQEFCLYGYSLTTFLASDFENIRRLNNFYYQSDIDVLILAGLNSDNILIKQIEKLKVPHLIVDTKVQTSDENIVNFNYEQGIYEAITYLLHLGHEKIAIISSFQNEGMKEMIEDGYRKAYIEANVLYDESLSSCVYSNNIFNACNDLLEGEFPPTALCTLGNATTLEVLKYMNFKGYNCPDHLSLIAYNIGNWSEVCNPPITAINVDKNFIVKKILTQLSSITTNTIRHIEQKDSDSLDVNLIVRSSTKSIGRGPFGEIAETPDVLELAQEDITRLRNKNYTVAISFHYTDTMWSSLNERGIRDVCNNLGIKILAVTDAHFDPGIQVSQLNSLLSMRPNVIISIPTDEILTSEGYKNIVNSDTKLVLITNVPKGLSPKDYISCVSLNERENGVIAGSLMGEYMLQHGMNHAGFVVHGANFFGTEQRDGFVLQTMKEDFQSIDITSVESFYMSRRAYEVCIKMLQEHPEIEALYVTWEGPCSFVKKALLDIGRSDVALFTTDLDYDIAHDIADNKMVKGVSSQNPYEQGRAIALAVAGGLLGKQIPSFIGMMPYKVTNRNILSVWQKVFYESPPREIVDIIRRQAGKEYV